MNDRSDFYVLTKKEKDNALSASEHIIGLVSILKSRCKLKENVVSILDGITHDATSIIETMTTDELLF